MMCQFDSGRGHQIYIVLDSVEELIIQPTLKIVAGPNGSGKTTFAETYFVHPTSNIAYLNPDLIATGLGPNDFEKASFQAGRVLLSEIKSKITNQEPFAFESTLSGLTYAQIIKSAKVQNYRIEIYFIYLKNVSLNISRIKTRVEQGGHNIPAKVVRRRLLKCFENFWNLYRDLCDDWTILDNSEEKPALIMDKNHYNNLVEKERVNFEKRFLKGKP